MSDEKPTYSISLRLRRTIQQDCYVSVMVNDALVKQNEDGSFGIDTDKFFAEGIKLGADENADWQQETTVVEVHPIQMARPDGRKSGGFEED